MAKNSDHRVPLWGGWTVWKWGRVRGAGFPARDVLQLASPEAAAAADRQLARGDRTDLDRELEIAGQRVSAALRETACEPKFREALLWQNRGALKRGIASLLRKPAGVSTKSTRKQERLLASYLQRYCVKNDTIGFFGPAGWCILDPSGDAVLMRPGPGLVDRRTVYFEYWCIDALARRIGDDHRLKPDLPPRRKPTVWVEGTTLYHPLDRKTTLPLEYARLLQACDGTTSARDIAETAIADTELELSDPEEIYDLLGQLEDQGLIFWTLEIPTTTMWPERHLRGLLSRAGEGGTSAIEILDKLESTRDQVARSAGDPEALDRALGALEETFEDLAGVQPTRAAGQMYAGRTLVYEDCRRDLQLHFGQPLIDRLGPPLSLLLESARWYTYEIARRYRHALDQIYGQIRAESGSAKVDYLRFWTPARALFPGPSAPGIVAEVTRQLQQKWHAILKLDTATDRRLELCYAQLESAVGEAFFAPHPGWPSARCHSPDVLIAASSAEAISRGDHICVLGEIHVGMNTVAAPNSIKEHPTPELLVAAREADLPQPCVAPTWSKAKSRADFYSVSRHDFDLETGDVRSNRQRDQVLAVGSLVVEQVDGRLVVGPRDGTLRFDVIAFLEQHLIAESFSQFGIIGSEPHTPRVTVDGVVLSRERWQIPSVELAFAQAKSLATRFVDARAWAKQHHLPRFVFVKLDTEVKPFFVDFESPILVDALARSVRKSREIVVTEMLPAIDDCWLEDADGRAFTSELRLVAVDPKPFSPTGVATGQTPRSE